MGTNRLTLGARVALGAFLCLSGAALPSCSCSDRGSLGVEQDGAPRDGALADARGDGGPLPDGALPGDAGPDAAWPDGPRPDGPRPDAPPWDAGTCPQESAWELVPRTITAVRLVDAPAPRVGVTERLEVDVQLLSGCDRLGAIDDVGYSGNATDFVDLLAQAWVPRNMACTPNAPIVTGIFTIAGRQHGNLRVVVTDHQSPGGGLRLTYDRSGWPGPNPPACGPGIPPGTVAEGGGCMTDCECAAGLSCIGYFGFVGESWSCLRACVDFQDCEAAETCPFMVADGPPLVCLGGGDQCQPGQVECPAGFGCVVGDPANLCLDQRTAPTGAPCACDAQCPPGHLCDSNQGGLATCEIPCDRDAECPAPGGTAYLVCGTRNVCVPLE
jgi:hypothetical protein